jgi:hypothetical protein
MKKGKLCRNRKFRVGKVAGFYIYVHRKYGRVLSERVQQAKTLIPVTFLYTVVKYNQRTNEVSFIESPDFDAADEPTVGSSYRVDAKGRVTKVMEMEFNPLDNIIFLSCLVIIFGGKGNKFDLLD